MLSRGIFCSLVLGSVFALPSSMEVVKGKASALSKDSHLVIESSGNTVLHWDQFSIGPQESLFFSQKEACHAVLNQVTGKMGSEILGSLFSNGAVYLLNPNGILIGPGAKICSLGFIASTLHVLDEELFCKQNVSFQGESEEKIVHLGQIICPQGDVFLLAKHVENRGQIEALQGAAVLGGASELLLCPEGRGKFLIRCSREKEGSVVHEGEIRALFAQIGASGTPYAQAIHMNGKVQTHQIAKEKGRILIKAHQGEVLVEGELSATGIEGGAIDIFGDEVIIDSARIDASGQNGGGLVRLGGDFGGEIRDEITQRADLLHIGPHVEVFADAKEKGDGGKIAMWGTDLAHNEGHFYARGGDLGGDGGFVEISCEKQLSIDEMRVNALAPYGKAGTFLIDPTDITLTIATTANGVLSACPGSSFTPSAATSSVAMNSIATNLGTCNVTISTVSGSGGTGDLVVDTGGVFPYTLTWAAATTLTLHAENTLRLGNPLSEPITFSNTNAGGVPFTAFDLTADAGGLVVPAGVTLSTSRGNISLTGSVSSGFLGGVSISQNPANPTTITTNTGHITIEALDGGMTLGSPRITTTSGNITLTAANPSNVSEGSGLVISYNPADIGSIQSTNGTITATASAFSSTASAFSFERFDTTPILTTGGDIEININSSGGDIQVLQTPTISCTAAGHLTISSTDALQIVPRSGQDGVIHFTTGSGAISVSAPSISLNGSEGVFPVYTAVGLFETQMAGGGISLEATAGNLNFGTNSGGEPTFSTAGGDIDLIASGSINMTDTNALPIIINSVGSIFFNGAASAFTSTEALQLSATGDIEFFSTFFTDGPLDVQPTASTTTFSGAVTGGGSLDITSTNIVQSSTVNCTGAVLYNATNISLANNITSAAAITLSGSTTLTGNAILSSTGSAAITTGAIDGGGNNFGVASGTGTRTIDSITNVGTFSVSGSGAVSVTNAASATSANFSGKSAGSNITFGGAVTFTSITTAATNYRVIFNGGGTVTNATTFSNTGGATFAGSPITFTGGLVSTAGTTITSTTVNTTANPMTFGALSLAGTTNLNTSNGIITLAAVTGAQALTINPGTAAANITSLNVSSFTVTSGGAISISGATIAPTVNLSAKSAGSNVTFGGAVTITTLTTGAANYATIFNGGGTVTNNTTFLNTGGVSFANSPITFTGGVNTTAGVTNLSTTVMSPNAINLGDVLLLATSAATGAGGVVIAGTVNNNFALTLTSSGGNVVLQDVIGGITPLHSLTVSGNLIQVTGNISAQGGTLTFNDPVELLADTVFTDTGNTGITFLSTISGNFDLTVNATQGDIAVGGAIDVSGATGADVSMTGTIGSISVEGIDTSGSAGNGGSVTLSAEENVTVGGAIDSTGTVGGTVEITSTSGSVLVHNITTSGGAGNAGNITLQPNPNFTADVLGVGTVVPDGRLALYGSLIADSMGGTKGEISLSATGRTEGMSVATIYGDPNDSNLVIVGDVLTIGDFEAITVFGDIDFTLDTSARVGDCVALDSLSITAPTIFTLLHESYDILSSFGELYENQNLHFLAIDSVTLTGTQMPVGTGDDPDITTITGFTRSELKDALVYMGYVLNFDIDVPPPPSPAVEIPGIQITNQQKIIFDFDIANTQLEYFLPKMPDWELPIQYAYQKKLYEPLFIQKERQ